MEQRVTTYSQYSISSNVNGIKNMEAQTLDGLSVQKIYFQPDVNLDLAIAQIVAATNSIRALMPPGIQPPVIVQYNASSVPVAAAQPQLRQPERAAALRLRHLSGAPAACADAGITLPTPAGGKYRQIMVDIDPAKLLGARADAARRRQRRQCPEPDACPRATRRSATRNTPSAPTRRRRPSTT